MLEGPLLLSCGSADKILSAKFKENLLISVGLPVGTADRPAYQSHIRFKLQVSGSQTCYMANPFCYFESMEDLP